MPLESIAAPSRLNASVQKMALFNMPPMQSRGRKCGKGQLLWEDEGYLWWHCTTDSFPLHSREWPGRAGLLWAGFHIWTPPAVFTAVVTPRQGLDAEIQLLPIKVHKKEPSLYDAFLRKGLKVTGRWLTSPEAEVSKTECYKSPPCCTKESQNVTTREYGQWQGTAT